MILALVVGGGFAYIKRDVISDKYDSLRYPAASIETPTDPTFTSPDGKVMLKVPDHARKNVTDVTFKYDKNHAEELKKSSLPFKWLGTPVDITPMTGTLKSDKVAVSIKYDPKLIPKGFSALQVGMGVYDTNFETWIPILNAKADASTNTVTALAPHFSQFGVIVLDPMKQLEFAGKQIKLAWDATTTVAKATFDIVSGLTQELVKDLVGQVDPLSCKPTSTRVQATTTGDIGKLQSCVETSGNNDRLRLSNGFAFPLLTDPLPTGMELDITDITTNNPGVTELLRGAFWASRNKAYISGANHSSITVTPLMQEPTKIKMEVDSEAIAFDVGLAVLMILAPEGAAAKTAATTALKSIVAGKKIADLTGVGAKWFNTAYGFMDCVVATSHDTFVSNFGIGSVDADEMFTKDGYGDAVNLAHDCLSTLLDGWNLKGALADLLTNLKVIPEVINSAVYMTADALTENLPSQFDSIKTKPLSVTISRKDVSSKPAPAKPTKEPSAVPTSADGVDLNDFDGTWYLNHGYASLSIDKQWGGTFKTKFFVDVSVGHAEKGWYNISMPMIYAPGADGALNGYLGVPTSMTEWDNPSSTIKATDEAKAYWKGKAITIFTTGNPHVLRLSPDDLALMGQSNMCDKYANQRAGDGPKREEQYVQLCNQ
ncbi:MAG TPA: hypothetical protein VLF59_04405 [Candidatus Saccharimonadales bacterium]|nr:hypothetical protein [Candidatus Saccharimonadales bacterium]